MILSQQEANRLYKEHPNKGVIAEMRTYAQHVYMHFTGMHMDSYLAHLEQYENPAQAQMRKKLAKSNKALMSRWVRPADKVYSAKGGSIYYDMSTNNVARFKEMVSESDEKKWLKDTWQNVALTDPNGVVFCEVGQNDVQQVTYGIDSIYEYKQDSTGKYEYIMFEPVTVEENGENVKYMRVVDDVIDATYKVDDDDLVYIPSLSYPNYFEFVPAIQNTTRHKIKDVKFKTSQIDEIIELADEYLLDNSIKVIYKKLHGFPKFWEYAQGCNVCKSTGLVEGKRCKACDGTGIRMKKDVTDVTILVPPKKQRDEDGEGYEITKIAPDVAGYVSPDLEAWRMMNEELDRLETQGFKTLWGTHNVDDAKSETATGRFIDVQPVNDRLDEFKQDAERIFRFILFCKGKFYFMQSFGNVSVNLGSRYMIESSDAIYKKYDEARVNGAPDTVLNYLLEQFYYAEFGSDDMNRDKNIKLMRVEPFIHKKLTDLQQGGYEYNAKIYYNEWLKSIDEINILLSSSNELNTMFNEYLKENGLQRISGTGSSEEQSGDDGSANA